MADKQSNETANEAVAAKKDSLPVAYVKFVFRSFFRNDGTFSAAIREGIKDVRSSMMEVFFGHGERASDPGTLFTPTQGEIAAARDPERRSLREAVNDNHPYDSEQEQAHERHASRGR